MNLLLLMLMLNDDDDVLTCLLKNQRYNYLLEKEEVVCKTATTIQETKEEANVVSLLTCFVRLSICACYVVCLSLYISGPGVMSKYLMNNLFQSYQ